MQFQPLLEEIVATLRPELGRFGIRSERRLCEQVHLNLAYRWFCRLDLEQRGPDHSTFSKNRTGRFRQSDAFAIQQALVARLTRVPIRIR